MTAITRKNEKIGAAASSLPENFSIEEFTSRFQEHYPKDWEKLEKSYRDHERKAKPGKGHPMPTPEQYLKNALHVWRRKPRET